MQTIFQRMARLGIRVMLVTVLAGVGPRTASADDPCSPSDEKLLLTLARDTLKTYLCDHKIPNLKDYALTPAMRTVRGVFVTLKNRESGTLRGCIGYVVGKKPLAEAIVDCTVQASTRDRRFPAMRKGEETDVTIEISILTPPRRITSIEKIQVGRHGLIITKGLRSGVLLPQVPIEWGWDRQAFLQAICRKAGLPEGAWHDGAELYTFQAHVFGENPTP